MNEATRYLTPKQAAGYLGVSVWTVYKLVDRRKIPFIPLTVSDPSESKKAMVRLDRLALDRWMESQAVNPPQDH